jgi:hypothetical protein
MALVFNEQGFLVPHLCDDRPDPAFGKGAERRISAERRRGNLPHDLKILLSFQPTRTAAQRCAPTTATPGR